MNELSPPSLEKPVKVALVYNSAWYLYQFRAPLIRELQSRGFEVHGVSPKDGAEEKLIAMGVRHHPITLSQHGANPLNEFLALASLARTLREIAPDLVISYTIKCNIYCGLLRYLFGFKQIVNIVGLGRVFERGGFSSFLARSLYRLAIFKADATFFQNREDRDSFVAQDVVPLTATVVTPGSGVNLNLFSLSPATTATPLVFFMYSRLIPAKGFDLFMNAAAVIRERHGNSVEFWVAGGLDGEQQNSRALKCRLEAASAAGSIRFLGYQNDIKDLLQKCTTVVLPSTYNEGVPRSLLEALASGKSIITTDWKGCRETLDGDSNGRLIPPGDVTKLVTAIEQILNASTEQRQQMGLASRKLAERIFDERIVLDAYLGVIDRLVAASASVNCVPVKSQT